MLHLRMVAGIVEGIFSHHTSDVASNCHCNPARRGVSVRALSHSLTHTHTQKKRKEKKKRNKEMLEAKCLLRTIAYPNV